MGYRNINARFCRLVSLEQSVYRRYGGNMVPLLHIGSRSNATVTTARQFAFRRPQQDSPPGSKPRRAVAYANGRGERIRTSGPLLLYGPCAARAPRLRLAPRPAPGFRPQGRPGFAVPRRLRRPPEVRTSHPNQKDPVTDVTRSIYGRGERIRTSGPLLPKAAEGVLEHVRGCLECASAVARCIEMHGEGGD